MEVWVVLEAGVVSILSFLFQDRFICLMQKLVNMILTIVFFSLISWKHEIQEIWPPQRQIVNILFKNGHARIYSILLDFWWFKQIVHAYFLKLYFITIITLISHIYYATVTHSVGIIDRWAIQITFGRCLQGIPSSFLEHNLLKILMCFAVLPMCNLNLIISNVYREGKIL